MPTSVSNIAQIVTAGALYKITNVPSSIPMCDIANGMARVPAPMMVLTRLILLLIHDASPPRFCSLRALLDRRLALVFLVLLSLLEN